MKKSKYQQYFHCFIVCINVHMHFGLALKLCTLTIKTYKHLLKINKSHYIYDFNEIIKGRGTSFLSSQ